MASRSRSSRPRLERKPPPDPDGRHQNLAIAPGAFGKILGIDLLGGVALIVFVFLFYFWVLLQRRVEMCSVLIDPEEGLSHAI
jgi:hypothetical protein